jgi:hypothetical protein
MVRIYDEEFKAISNWQWSQYLFKTTSPLLTSSCPLSVIHGAAEKYTFTVSHRFGQLSIVYHEDFKLTITDDGRTLETSARVSADSFFLVGFSVYRQTRAGTRTGELPLSKMETLEILPPSYNIINYALLESNLDPEMILL